MLGIVNVWVCCFWRKCDMVVVLDGDDRVKGCVCRCVVCVWG